MSHPILLMPNEVTTLIEPKFYDYFPIIVYFAFVVAVGFMMKRKASSSDEFLTGGRSLPAWVTGLAFVSANLGAVEIMGMSANGAQYGLPTFHYFWVGAIPAMLFLGVVMMPFYYGSKVRSVPEFMLKRYGTAAHLINGISFALAQLLIAGVNLYLLGKIVNGMLGIPLWISLIIAALIVLTYISIGGLAAAIYNEVLQFFVIVAALLPVTLIGLYRVGGYQGLTEKITKWAGEATNPVYQDPNNQLHSWPGTLLSGFNSPAMSVFGLVMGLGFVLAFGYWTTNFVEVQRAMASDSIAAAQKTPIIGTFVKMFIPFLVIIPGMVAGVLIPEIVRLKAGPKYMGVGEEALANLSSHVPAGYQVSYNDAMLLMMRDLLPNGLLGLAIAGLLASFMAGMAANVSAFNTVFTVDIYEAYFKPNESDEHYLKVGRNATIVACTVAVFTALIASLYPNIMDLLQQLFSMFNAPLFASFIIGMLWKRATPSGGWTGLLFGTLAALFVNVLCWNKILELPGQGQAFIAAGAAFVVGVLVNVVVSMFTKPKDYRELEGFVWSLTPKELRIDPKLHELPLLRRPIPLAIVSGVLVLILNSLFH
ncbi:sodium:solute symporter family protein [Varibaculum cambriense]|uniref:sodium:solute symporter family protein n=1 Tax=Varibaculum cambriense TaxID=184870 RepID=UPI0029145510|nr:sodium:solute symporter family protein [Varibaculum cambriense]MDU3273694.1 sodium:solute symporter family protein [Varibaculum cambriense]